jgi:peptidoglycan/xylan/chitin deacetylase (PgdA/CDA1 family)
MTAPARRGLLVLAYHAISPSWRHPLSTTPEAFRSQLGLLAARGYRGVTFSDAARSPSRERRVAVTFDDAFRSAAVHGRPIIDELGWPATVFVPTTPVTTREPMNWLGGQGGEVESMTWDDVEELAAHGWEVGSHTRTHRLLSALAPAEAAEELAGSREEIVTRTGRCDAISYAWGEVVPTVVEAARSVGYSTGSGLAGQFRFGDPMRVPRVAIADADGTGARFRLKISPLFWRTRATPAWGLVERARPASSPAESAAQSSAKV